MNKLILIKTNVNKQNQLKLEWVERYYQLKLKLLKLLVLNNSARYIKDSRYKAVYYLNPEYFFKGKISDRTQIIKNIIEYKFIQ